MGTAEAIQRIIEIQAGAQAEMQRLLLELLAHEERQPEPRPEEIIEDRPMSVRQVAEWLGVSPGYVYGLVRSGELQSYRLGTRIVVRRSRLEQWLENHEMTVVTDEEIEAMLEGIDTGY